MSEFRKVANQVDEHSTLFRIPAGFDAIGSTMPIEDIVFELTGIILFGCTHLAFGGSTACQALGLQIPRDIGVVGLNALGLTKVLSVPITTATTRVYPHFICTRDKLSTPILFKIPPTNHLMYK